MKHRWYVFVYGEDFSFVVIQEKKVFTINQSVYEFIICICVAIIKLIIMVVIHVSYTIDTEYFFSKKTYWIHLG
jgi:hypothetical protein